MHMFQAALFTAATCWLASPLLAQTSRLVPEAVSCQRCSIELEPVVTLGDSAGPGAVGEPQTLVRDSRGRTYVVTRNAQSVILVFDEQGRFLREVGRQGQGPGEYSRISALSIRAGDTLTAYDSRLARRTILSPNLEFVRTEPFPFRIAKQAEFTSVGSGRMILATVIATRERIGYPFHLLDSSRVLRSFGAEKPEFRPDDERGNARAVTPSLTSSGVWASPTQRYVLEHWDEEGRRLATLVRDPKWFVPYASRRNADPANPPFPASYVQGVSQTEPNRLWTVVTVGDSAYRQAIAPSASDPRITAVLDDNLYMDTVVELIDTESGTVIVRRRFPAYFRMFASPSEIVTTTETSAGVPIIQVWRLRFQQPRGGK